MISICCIILVLVLGVLVAFFALSARTNYEDADTSQYEEIPESAPAWDVALDEKVTNILLIGADRNSDGSNGRSDTMMLMSIDARNKKIRLVSFLRDIYLDSIPTVGGERLNAAFAYGGPALTMQTIENYFRINVCLLYTSFPYLAQTG